MDTLLHHMRPWMQRSVEESEARMELMMDAKIHSTDIEIAPEASPAVEEDEVVMNALFGDTIHHRILPVMLGSTTSTTIFLTLRRLNG
ncbi:hypothetical protein MTR67_039988 [Solanum verrucosum]|uniref:Uncharacterized protein n=1 Tax=Solanum verrucosum TaxID=315347 RepID=A0AAF0UJK6_SOLVR|nr:hypothetical protein MTR67_039988 [Solanum verrucosum]